MAPIVVGARRWFGYARTAGTAEGGMIKIRLVCAVLVAFAATASSHAGNSAAGFLASPLKCGDPDCRFRYDQGVYTYRIMNSVLDHSLKRNASGFWQFGKLSNGGGDGVVVAFNSERANGRPSSGDETCIAGPIWLKPNPSAPVSTAMTNTSGCGGGYASYDEHPGYDYRADFGTPVYASASGTVLSLNGERCYKSNISGSCDDWGYVGIDHGNGFITQYGHLSKIFVRAGQPINAGDPIGLSGHTAPVAIGNHLHFEVLARVSGTYVVVDPYGWVGDGPDPLYSARIVPPAKLWR